MSYVVLARKYRPRNFEQMVGQDHVVQALTHALEQGRLHHAYLFTGTRGIGKTTVSRILAKSLNCTGEDGQGGITAKPCGVCPACRAIDADRYLDYTELDAASNRSIDEVRELIERAAYKPTVGRFKVFMIDEAHQLTKDAFNALLKTLEEPPEYLKFVLATTDPDKMLPTVLSRCLQFNLRPMAPHTVAQHLGRVLEAEQISADAGALRLLSRAARGSMRDALSLTDQAIAYGGGQLEEAAVRSMLGAVDRSHALRLVDALARRDGPAVLAECEALRGQGLSATGALEDMARLLQSMAVEQTVPGALDASDPDTEAVRALAPALAPDETQLLYSMVLHGRAELSLAPDEYAGLVMVLLRFLAFPAGGRTAGGRLQANGQSLAGATGPVAASAASPQVTAASAPLQVQTVARSRVVLPPQPDAAQAKPLQESRPQPVRPLATKPVVPTPSASSRPTSTPPPRPVPKLDGEAESRLRGGVASAQNGAANADEPPPWMDEAPPPELEDGTPAGMAESGRADAVLLADEPERSAPRSGAEGLVRPATRPLLRRTALGDFWADRVAHLQAEGTIVALVRELAVQAELLDREPVAGETAGEQWTLRVERDSLRNPNLAERLGAVLTAIQGLVVRLQIEPGQAQDSPALRDAEMAAQRQANAEDIIRQDPLVQSLLAQFKTARILPGSIRPV